MNSTSRLTPDAVAAINAVVRIRYRVRQAAGL